MVNLTSAPSSSTTRSKLPRMRKRQQGRPRTSEESRFAQEESPLSQSRSAKSKASRCGSPRDLSWKVRYRTYPWLFSPMSKLYRARSLLYRRQILQVNMRWKALDEIYNIYMLLHRSDLNIPAKLCQTFSHFRQNVSQKRYFSTFFIEFRADFDEILFGSQKWNILEFWKCLNFG